MQTFRACGGMHYPRGERFDAEARDGSDRLTSHGLCGKLRGELRESEGVNALAAGLESMGGELVRGRAGGRDDEDLGVCGLLGEELRRVAQERDVGARLNEGARGHR